MKEKFKLQKITITLFLSFFGVFSYAQSTETLPEPKVITPGNHNQPPSDAIILLKNDLSNWETTKNGEVKWKYEDNILTVTSGEPNILTKQKFGDIQLHIEWRTPPADPTKEGQGRGNSGIYFHGKYEVQVLDSYQNKTYSDGQAGAIYGQYVPLVNASRPPMEWQTYDIIHKAPEFNEDGSVKEPGYLTVFHNGVLIQYHSKIKGPTAASFGNKEYEKTGPIMIQNHGNPVSYRNIWVREL